MTADADPWTDVLAAWEASGRAAQVSPVVGFWPDPKISGWIFYPNDGLETYFEADTEYDALCTAISAGLRGGR